MAAFACCGFIVGLLANASDETLPDGYAIERDPAAWIGGGAVAGLIIGIVVVRRAARE